MAKLLFLAEGLNYEEFYKQKTDNSQHRTKIETHKFPADNADDHKFSCTVRLKRTE